MLDNTVATRITANAMSCGDAHEQWLRFVERHIFKYELSPEIPKEPDFALDAVGRNHHGWSIGRIATWAGRSQLARRRAQICGDSQGRYVAYLPVCGEVEIEQFNRRQRLGPQGLILVSGTEPLIHRKFGDNDTYLLVLPREFVDQRIVKSEEVCARLHDCGQGVGLLAQQSLLTLQQTAAQMSPAEFETAARLVGELILLSARGDCEDLTADVRPIRASSLARMKRVIRRRLCESDLRLSDVAAECGISLSYLHTLFREDGRTASEFLRLERLQLARRRLSETGRRPMTVTEVAFACGFTNMSSFSTAFKSAFSISPRDVLRAAK